jgi:hypothetical protein
VDIYTHTSSSRSAVDLGDPAGGCGSIGATWFPVDDNFSPSFLTSALAGGCGLVKSDDEENAEEAKTLRALLAGEAFRVAAVEANKTAPSTLITEVTSCVSASGIVLGSISHCA